MPPPIQKRGLPSKEASLFKELLTLYETRQLKKGIKTADNILKKFPDHGETLCMKGLVLVHLGKREEGTELVKKGVRLDLTSHICWHVFGLIQKGEKNYEEALKSYSQALRFDKENINILRDAAHLQTQLRLHDSLVDARHTLLRLRPNLRQHWVALSVAHYLAGNLLEANKILEHYESILKNIPDFDIEHSETLLYHIRILSELGQVEPALSILDVNAKSRAIVDRTAIMETRAKLLSSISSPKAPDAWRALIEHNSDCYDYYTGFLICHGIDLDNLTPETRTQACSILAEFSSKIPRATAPKRLALALCSDSDFTGLAKPYILDRLQRGIPSLYTDIKTLYTTSPSKRALVESIVIEALASFTSSPGAEEQEQDQRDQGQDPTHHLWTLYFLSQHYSLPSPSSPSFPSPPPPSQSPSDTPSSYNTQKSLTHLQDALSHTPTLPELYTAKARILKRSGDLDGAIRAMEEARALDGQDRFLNSKCWKYYLRAAGVSPLGTTDAVAPGGSAQSYVERASEIAGLFTKKDAPSPAADLEDMQSLLFLVEEADAYTRMGKLGLALKRYLGVVKVFGEMQDDQYDFHGYSIRKFMICIYLDMIKWADQLYTNPAHVKSALEATRILIKLHDNPALASAAASGANLTDEEKKAKKKAAKKAAQDKASDDKKSHSDKSSTNEDKGLEPPLPKDEDPDGTKLLTMPDPIERAFKILAPVIAAAEAGKFGTGQGKSGFGVRKGRKGCVDEVEVWCVVYDVAVRRSKYLQAVKALNHAKAIDAEHPELHIRIVDFAHRLSTLSPLPPDPIGSLLTSAREALIPSADISLDTFNSQYLQRHGSSPRAVMAVARVHRILGAAEGVVEDMFFEVLGNPEGGVTWRDAYDALVFLRDEVKSERADEYRKKCDERFEFATVFKTREELEGLVRREREASEGEGKEGSVEPEA